MIRYNMIEYGLISYNKMWYDVIRYDVIYYDTEWYNTMWHDVIRHNMIWCDILFIRVWNPHWTIIDSFKMYEWGLWTVGVKILGRITFWTSLPAPCVSVGTVWRKISPFKFFRFIGNCDLKKVRSVRMSPNGNIVISCSSYKYTPYLLRDSMS